MKHKGCLRAALGFAPYPVLALSLVLALSFVLALTPLALHAESLVPLSGEKQMFDIYAHDRSYALDQDSIKKVDQVGDYEKKLRPPFFVADIVINVKPQSVGKLGYDRGVDRYYFNCGAGGPYVSGLTAFNGRWREEKQTVDTHDTRKEWPFFRAEGWKAQAAGRVCAQAKKN